MLRLHQQGPVSRLEPIIGDEVLCARLVEAVWSSEAFALAGSREPFRALNYRGTAAYHELLNDVGKVLNDYFWEFLRNTQPAFKAPPGLFPTDVELILFHGACVGSEIISIPRGRETYKKIDRNALQLSLFDLEEPEVRTDGRFYLSLVVDVDELNQLRLYLALAVGRGPTSSRIQCDEIVMLHSEPILLDGSSPGDDGSGGAPTDQPVVPPVVPVIGEIRQAI